MRNIVAFLRSNPTAAVGAIMLAVILGMVIIAPALMVTSPTKLDILNKLAPPSLDHWLGTD